MNIRNNINQLLKIKITKCIDLLDVEYKTINISIDPYTDRERLLYEQKNKPTLSEKDYNQILNGQITVGGLYLSDKKQIKLFLFLFDDLDTNASEVLNLIGNIYHEIRHAWQDKNELFLDESDINSVDENLESYFMLESEKDAYRFQLEQTGKHANKILKIFNIDRSVKSYTLSEDVMKSINS